MFVRFANIFVCRSIVPVNITDFLSKMALKDFLYHVILTTTLFAALLVPGKFKNNFSLKVNS